MLGHILWSVLNREKWLGISLAAMVILLGFVQLDLHSMYSTGFYTLLATIPFVLHFEQSQKGGNRFGFLGIAMLLLYFVLQVNTLLFLGILFCTIYFVEQYVGKLNVLAVVLMLLCSPLFAYVIKVFGFEIRILLTEIAGTVLQWIGYTHELDGNTIVTSEGEFTVESDCAGLHLATISLIITLVFLRTREKQESIRYSFGNILVLLFITFGFVMVANLLRICALVLLKISAESLMHDAIGLLCMIVYTLIPMYWITGRWAGKKSGFKSQRNIPVGVLGFVLQLLVITIVLALAFQPISPLEKEHSQKTETFAINWGSFEREATKFGAWKFHNEEALIYYKPCTKFWKSDHNPSICWRGSGYVFSAEKKWQIENHEVYQAKLKKGDVELYTAWWFQNEQGTTTSQWTWRTRMMQGQDSFWLVNVTCESEEELRENVENAIGSFDS